MNATAPIPARGRALAGRALVSIGLAACLLGGAGALYGCKRKPKVRFIKACPIHSQPNHGSSQVGTVQPQRAYDVLGRKDEWYRVEVFQNRNWGWTRCPTVE